MSDTLVQKMIDALRDMAAKVDEVVEREDVDIHETMRWPQAGSTATRKICEPRYDRAWLSGRLLGMADTADAFLVEGKKGTP